MPSKPIKGFIHPLDPRPACKSKSRSPSTRYWARLKDCLTGQGPDIFVGVINRPRSCPKRLKRDGWSNWNSALNHNYDRDGGDWVRAKRESERVYNFRTRRYETFRGEELNDGGMWSDVAYCGDERHWDPIMIRDAWGHVFDLRNVGEHRVWDERVNRR